MNGTRNVSSELRFLSSRAVLLVVSAGGLVGNEAKAVLRQTSRPNPSPFATGLETSVPQVVFFKGCTSSGLGWLVASLGTKPRLYFGRQVEQTLRRLRGYYVCLSEHFYCRCNHFQADLGEFTASLGQQDLTLPPSVSTDTGSAPSFYPFPDTVLWFFVFSGPSS